jgi:hypothetical protein
MGVAISSINAQAANASHTYSLSSSTSPAAFGQDNHGHKWSGGSVGSQSSSTTLAPTTTTTVPSTTSTTVAVTTTTVPVTTTTVPPTTSTTVPPTTSTTVPSVSSPPGDLFGSFDTPLSPTAPVSSISSSLAADIINQYKTYYGTFGIQDQYPIVTVSASQATVNVATSAGCNSFQSNTGAVPIPASAASLLPGTGDNPLIVWQPSTATEWEFWQANYSNGSWSACWGGKIQNVGASNGLFQEPYGLAASGFSYLATAITEADIQSGSINHPIALQIPLCNLPFVAPATRSDCGNNAGTPAEGMLFRLPASAQMPSGMTPFGQMVFRALQNYGAYVTDHAGAVVIVAEEPADWTATGHTGTDPLTASWAGSPQYATMNGMPWSSLQLVQ